MSKLISWGSRTDVRFVTCAVACAVAAVSASGATMLALFHQPSTIKYIVTVVGPAFLALVALARAPLRILVGVAIIVSPVAFAMAVSGLQMTPLLVVLIVAGVVGMGQARRPRMGWLGVASLAAAALLIPAIASGTSPGSYAVWLAGTTMMGWLVYSVAREPGGGRFVLRAIACSVVIQGAIMIYEYQSGHQLNLYNQSGVATLGSSYFFNYGSATRYTGTLPDPNALGNVLALGIPLLICLAAIERRLWARIAVAVGGALTLLGLMLSFSRSSWIGAAVGSALCVIALPQGRRLGIAAGVGATVAIVLFVGLGLGGSSLRTRVASAFNPTNVQSTYRTTALGDQLRVRLWTAALRSGEAEPLTGSGFGNLVTELNRHGVSVPPAAHAQSWYLQLFGEAGVLGLAALLCWLVAAFHDLWRALRRFRILAAGTAGSVIAMLITWTTDIEPRYLQVSALIAAVFGLIGALGAARAPADPELV